MLLAVDREVGLLEEQLVFLNRSSVLNLTTCA